MPITYNNVPTKDGGAGNLFQDMKFWVAQRVSGRSEVLHNIRSNGGIIEPLEKNAEYLIADPIRQPPPGSYKFAWITESIGKGQLLPPENYLIQNATAAVPTRKTSSGVAARSARVPFTPGDDRYLWLFVTEMESKGEPTEGNEIYKKLEMMNPRHTYQSWRNRWVKQLRGLERPKFTKEDFKELRSDIRRLLPGSSPEPIAAAASAIQQTSPATVSAPAADEPPTPSQPVRDNGIKIRHKFTREEDEILLTQWVDVLGSYGSIKKNAFFDELANERHTANSWRDRLFKTLDPVVKNKLKTDIETIGKSGIPTFVKWFHKGRSIEAYEEMLQSQRSAPLSEPEEEQESEEKPDPTPTPKQERQDAAAPVKQIKKNQVRVNQFPNSSKDGGLRPEHTTVSDIEDETPERRRKPAKRATRRKSPSKSPVHLNETEQTSEEEAEQEEEHLEDAQEAKGQLEEAEYAEGDEQIEVEQREAVQQQVQEETREEEAEEFEDEGPYTRSRFFEDYNQWLEATNHRLAHFPSIAGRSFDLFDLWNQVVEQDTTPNERSKSTWKIVAENLGVDWIVHPDAPEQFRLFFQQHLANFEEALLSFEDRDEEMTDSQSVGAFPSSPAAARQLKRPSVLSDDPFETSQRVQKRRRRDRDDEIPSTPDERTKTAHLRQYDGAGDEDVGLLGASTPHQTLGHADTQTQKETQFFDAPEYGEDDMDDMSPSRQLRLESDAAERPVYARSSPPPVPVELFAHGTPTPKRVAKTPFLQDDSDIEEEEAQMTPVRSSRDVKGKGKEVAIAKRRSLPKSFILTNADEGSDDDVEERNGQVQYPKLPHRAAAQSPAQLRSTVATHTAQSDAQISRFTATSTSFASRSSSTSVPAAQQVEEIINHHISLGYTRDMVVQAMYATTWEAGLSSIVMEGLKQGGTIPTNARGVWTDKDDANLMLLDGKAEIAETGARLEKKIAKASKKIENKFTPDMIEKRREFWKEGNVWRLAK